MKTETEKTIFSLKESNAGAWAEALVAGENITIGLLTKVLGTELEVEKSKTVDSPVEIVNFVLLENAQDLTTFWGRACAVRWFENQRDLADRELSQMPNPQGLRIILPAESRFERENLALVFARSSLSRKIKVSTIAINQLVGRVKSNHLLPR